MPTYAFKAADARGGVVRGTRFAGSEEELEALLKQAGMYPIECSESRASGVVASLQSVNLGSVSRQDLIEFSNNMGVMIRAGIPLLKALDELRTDTEKTFFKKILDSLIDDIHAGDSLHIAMAKHRRIFPPLYVNVIEIGEATGRLDAVFFDLARHYKRIENLVKNIRKALIYPCFVLIALVIAAFVFLTMVFPPLFSLLKEFDVPLPTVTIVVMNTSEFLQKGWPAMLVAAVTFAVLFVLARRYESTKYYLDWCEMHIPYVRTLALQLRLAFFMRYLAMLLTGGMDILRSLQLATDSVHNLVIKRFLTASRQRVIDGELFSASLRGSPFIPNMAVRMIAIGEESGNMAEQMEYVADHYNEELERRITSALALMEPLLLFMLAGLALALVMGVLLPLYNLVSELSSGVGTGTM